VRLFGARRHVTDAGRSDESMRADGLRRNVPLMPRWRTPRGGFELLVTPPVAGLDAAPRASLSDKILDAGPSLPGGHGSPVPVACADLDDRTAQRRQCRAAR
jgi:hypothetical protein